MTQPFVDWKFQDDILDQCRDLMRRDVRRILIQSETGSGKTVMGSKMFAGCLQRQKTADFFVHRKELIKQTAITLQRAQIPFGITAAGMHCGESELIQLCSVQTTCKMQRRKPFMATIDEAHHIGSETYNTCDGEYVFGLSATPMNPRGHGLGAHFTHMVRGPTIPELQAIGMLSQYKYFAPAIPDLSEVSTHMGDYSKDEVTAIMEGKTIVGDILREWFKHASDMVTIGFAPSIAASKKYVEMFQAAGITAAHIDGKMPRGIRDEICRQYAAGEIQVLWNVGICEEGFDIGAYGDGSLTIECVIDAAPTQSLRKKRQINGRGLRRKLRPAIFIDAAGNFTRHGMPCDVINWVLDGECKPVPRPFTVTQCEKCYLVFRNSGTCPHCGDVRPIHERKVMRTEGELREIKKSDAIARKLEEERLKVQKLKERKAAKTLEQLVAFAIRWKHDNPNGWARMFLEQRNAWKNRR